MEFPTAIRCPDIRQIPDIRCLQMQFDIAAGRHICQSKRLAEDTASRAEQAHYSQPEGTRVIFSSICLSI